MGRIVYTKVVHYLGINSAECSGSIRVVEITRKSEYTFSLGGFSMDKNSVYRTNIIGAGEVGSAVSVDMDKNYVHKINSFYWDTKGNDFLGAIVLPLYGAYVSEEKCRLFGDVTGKKMLEIGCGNGQSLQYLGERKASELWAVDISEKQMEENYGQGFA